jgi:predicted Rossmann fold flavoprotein
VLPKGAIFVGGGAAGFFAAINFAQAAPKAPALILEKSLGFLQKVRISGGGRCNVTHSLFEPREFARRYPRGERELIGLLHRFQARDTVKWFEDRGVTLKAEADGRMFPVTDCSQTIIDCLMGEARRLSVVLRANAGVELISRTKDGFEVGLVNGERLPCTALLLATGGSRSPAMGALATSLGHSLAPPVPSLFTLQIPVPWLRELAGVSVPEAELSVAAKLREKGPLLITHWGLSGPVTLRLSAWGARPLNDLNYDFVLSVNWLPRLKEEQVREELASRVRREPAKSVVNSPIAPLSARLWEALVLNGAKIPRDKRWSELGRAGAHALLQTLTRSEFQVTGKSLNKEEFVTCGGVKLSEVNFKSMESRICPGLFFAGETLDIDGITGGFNFQAAWTTGWVAGNAMAERFH